MEGEQLRQLVRGTNRVYIYELLAMGATIRELRQKIIGQKLVLMPDNAAVCAALMKGAANNDLGPIDHRSSI